MEAKSVEQVDATAATTDVKPKVDTVVHVYKHAPSLLDLVKAVKGLGREHLI